MLQRDNRKLHRVKSRITTGIEFEVLLFVEMLRFKIISAKTGLLL